jgi:hypothetical protein
MTFPGACLRPTPICTVYKSQAPPSLRSADSAALTSINKAAQIDRVDLGRRESHSPAADPPPS